ncbi:Nitrogen permease regulator 3, partial [Aspergillus hancockii]
MSSIARPPDPCLVAIILIVRSRAGPRFVFHYPPNPLSENGLRPAPKGRRPSRAKSSKSNESSSSSEAGSTSDEDEEEVHAQSQNPSSTHLAGSAVSAGRRWSNFGLDDFAASPGGESQRPGSIGSGRAVRKRGGNSDVEDDTGA